MSRHAVAHSLRIKFTMQLSSKFIFGRAFMRPLLSTMEVEAAPDWLNIKREAPDGDKPDKGGEKCGKLQRRKNQVESDAVGGKVGPLAALITIAAKLCLSSSRERRSLPAPTTSASCPPPR
eukprot:4045098-Pyramimonas_sp.AAC.1